MVRWARDFPSVQNVIYFFPRNSFIYFFYVSRFFFFLLFFRYFVLFVLDKSSFHGLTVPSIVQKKASHFTAADGRRISASFEVIVLFVLLPLQARYLDR